MKKETIYDETITNLFLLMQSYGEFGLIPRKSANSSSTCVDNCFIFGQIEEKDFVVVQICKFLLIISSISKFLLIFAHRTN